MVQCGVDARAIGLSRAFLDDLYAEWGGRDLESRDNIVSRYATRNGQVTYGIMYFAKSVGCWTRLRSRVDVDHSQPVISIGAGPMFCLLGWFARTRPTAKVYARDYLSWHHIRSLPSHKALADAVVGEVDYRQRFFPRTKTPQCTSAGASRATYLDATKLPRGATVLLPMALNHVLGEHQPTPDIEELASWFRDLESKAGTVILVDMPRNRAPEIWQQLEQITGLAPGAPVFSFRTESMRLSACYPDRTVRKAPENERRTGITWQTFPRASGCVFRSGVGWNWLT